MQSFVLQQQMVNIVITGFQMVNGLSCVFYYIMLTLSVVRMHVVLQCCEWGGCPGPQWPHDSHPMGQVPLGVILPVSGAFAHQCTRGDALSWHCTHGESVLYQYVVHMVCLLYHDRVHHVSHFIHFTFNPQYHEWIKSCRIHTVTRIWDHFLADDLNLESKWKILFGRPTDILNKSFSSSTVADVPTVSCSVELFHVS
jgi:hypothetical protein